MLATFTVGFFCYYIRGGFQTVIYMLSYQNSLPTQKKKEVWLHYFDTCVFFPQPCFSGILVSSQRADC